MHKQINIQFFEVERVYLTGIIIFIRPPFWIYSHCDDWNKGYVPKWPQIYTLVFESAVVVQSQVILRCSSPVSVCTIKYRQLAVVSPSCPHTLQASFTSDESSLQNGQNSKVNSELWRAQDAEVHKPNWCCILCLFNAVSMGWPFWKPIRSVWIFTFIHL